MKKHTKRFKLGKILKTHIINNKKAYCITLLIFIIGIFLGVLFINNVDEEKIKVISDYINDFTGKFKTIENLDSLTLFKNSVITNLILLGSLWFFGTTVIGIPIVFGIIAYRGFCLGYTISACITSLGAQKGLAFIFSNVFLQNLIFIPVIIAVGVSGIKLYKSIIKDKRRENVKLEILRHTLLCGLMSILLIIASAIEVFISNSLFKLVVQYL